MNLSLLLKTTALVTLLSAALIGHAKDKSTSEDLFQALSSLDYQDQKVLQEIYQNHFVDKRPTYIESDAMLLINLIEDEALIEGFQNQLLKDFPDCKTKLHTELAFVDFLKIKTAGEIHNLNVRYTEDINNCHLLNDSEKIYLYATWFWRLMGSKKYWKEGHRATNDMMHAISEQQISISLRTQLALYYNITAGSFARCVEFNGDNCNQYNKGIGYLIQTMNQLAEHDSDYYFFDKNVIYNQLKSTLKVLYVDAIQHLKN